MYRLRSVSGRLLYVGKTYSGGLDRRLERHKATFWGWLIYDPHTTVESHPTEEDAFEAEWDAIKSERPLANVVGQWARGRAFERVLERRMRERGLSGRRGAA